MSGANVNSFEAVRDFRSALATFADEARDALATYDIELRRTLDWVLQLQPEAWKQEIRRSEDAIQNAKLDLARCRMQRLPDGGEPACMEEKKAMARAKARLEFSQDKLLATKKWGQTLDRESIQYISQATQLGDLLDAELPRAIALIDRVLLALEAYVGVKSDHSPLGPAPVSRPAAATAAKPAEAPAAEETPADPAQSEEAEREQQTGSG